MKSATRPRGEVLAGISSGKVRLYREHVGNGQTKAKTYVLDRSVAPFAVNEEIITTDVVDELGDRTDVGESVEPA